MKQPSFTIGIEEEYQIIDPVTRELKSYITEMLKADTAILREIKPELHQSMVEVGTQVADSLFAHYNGVFGLINGAMCFGLPDFCESFKDVHGIIFLRKVPV